ncbi:RNA methyltransferase [Spirochaetia bacterium]|nr:RNA methyltransferase [Spirochaetia bacterium]
MTLSDIVIILCRPSEPGNVGAVCRAMKNMGLSRLRLVLSPEGDAPAPLDEGVIRARAVHAGDLWDGAETFASLEAAAADCSLLIGTTRRRGQRRKNTTMAPSTLAAYLRERPDTSGGSPTALAFGNERTGLDDRELALCNIASHIPVSDAFPSLNLSHAVQIYTYELYRALGASACTERQNGVKGEWVPMDRTRIDDLAASVTGSLGALGFYKQPGRELQEQFFRDVFARAGLTEREGRYMAYIFTKAARLAAKGASSTQRGDT